MLEYSLPDRSEYPVNAGVLLPAELSGRAKREEIRREENNRRRIKRYSHRIKLDSTDAERRFLRAEVYLRSMKYAGARNDFRTACDLGKDAPSVAHAVARIYAMLCITETASNWFAISGNASCAACVSGKMDMDEQFPACCGE